MSTVRRAAGATRTCPHCRIEILASAAVCPSCRKHLRFDSSTAAATSAAVSSFSPLRIEGSIRHPEVGEAWEYSVLVSIKNDRGDEVTRQIVGVGALQPGEERTFTFSVEVFTPDGVGVPERLKR
ncbi:MAG: hypothetical protein ABJF01_20320 [bacterium]